mmetsp:Transcript_3820/g.7604  ORF Transcript_3820/g.7604 Transcript_3820/m.7604 type:complete len:211 (+) Transcript_3820:922-1554(+)
MRNRFGFRPVTGSWTSTIVESTTETLPSTPLAPAVGSRSVVGASTLKGHAGRHRTMTRTVPWVVQSRGGGDAPARPLRAQLSRSLRKCRAAVAVAADVALGVEVPVVAGGCPSTTTLLGRPNGLAPRCKARLLVAVGLLAESAGEPPDPSTPSTSCPPDGRCNGGGRDRGLRDRARLRTGLLLHASAEDRGDDAFGCIDGGCCCILTVLL